MIHFSAGDLSYAVDAAELAGVAGGCPATTYPGLPEGVSGIVQWGGRIFPVVARFGGAEADLRSATFIFSAERGEGAYPEVAIAVDAPVNVFFAEKSRAPQEGAPSWIVAVVTDGDGRDAMEIKLSAIARYKKEGKKVAA
jgi:chemotaxis signal transduction protein